ncbi:MAG: phasin family protein [Bauldia sp.]
MQPTRFEIPQQMRDLAEKTVEQARSAFEQVLDATQKAVAQAADSPFTLGEGAADLSRQSLAYLEENIAASFDLARRLAQARTLEEVTALQQEFVQRQMMAAAEQSKTLGTMASRVATETVKKPRK